MQAALLELEQEVAPARPALPDREFDTQDAAPSIPADRHSEQDSLATDHAGLAHSFVPSIEDQIRVGLLKPAAGELGQAGVQALVDGTDARGRKTMAAQLLGDRLDLPRRYTLHVHLGQRRHECPLRALVALEQLRREPAFTVLRHP